MDVLYKPYEDLLHRVDFQEKHSFDKYEVIALCIKTDILEARFQRKRKSVGNLSSSPGSRNYSKRGRKQKRGGVEVKVVKMFVYKHV